MQSLPLRHGRKELEERAARLEAQYADESVRVGAGARQAGQGVQTLALQAAVALSLGRLLAWQARGAVPWHAPVQPTCHLLPHHRPPPQVPRPPHWGGFVVRPLCVEFWQGRPSRLHDRLRYVRSGVDVADWRLERLAP